MSKYKYFYINLSVSLSSRAHHTYLRCNRAESWSHASFDRFSLFLFFLHSEHSLYANMSYDKIPDGDLIVIQLEESRGWRSDAAGWGRERMIVCTFPTIMFSRKIRCTNMPILQQLLQTSDISPSLSSNYNLWSVLLMRNNIELAKKSEKNLQRFAQP